MDMSIYHEDFTQHDLFGLFSGASGGRALRDTYRRVYLVTIATKGGRTTLERYGKDYVRELASREKISGSLQTAPWRSGTKRTLSVAPNAFASSGPRMGSKMR